MKFEIDIMPVYRFSTQIVLSVLLILFGTCSAFSQMDKLLLKRQSVEDGNKMEFTITEKKKVKRFKRSRNYYWFKSQKIHKSQGGASGSLLHGTFKKYNLEGGLLEAGAFKNGLKHGTWKTWHQCGNIKTITRYRYGKKVGKYQIYDENNNLIDSGKFKNRNKKIKVEKIDSLKEEVSLQDTVETKKGMIKFRFFNRKKKTHIDSSGTGLTK